MSDAASATLRFILERDPTGFARILRGHLDDDTPQQIAYDLRAAPQWGDRWTASMVRAYIKGIPAVVNGDISGLTANQAEKISGKIRLLLSLNPPPDVDNHLRRVLADLGQDTGSGIIPNVTAPRRRRGRQHSTYCPRCTGTHAGEC